MHMYIYMVHIYIHIYIYIWSMYTDRYEDYTHVWGLVCQKQVSRAGISNYITKIMWDVIICPCLWYPVLAHQAWYMLRTNHRRVDCLLNLLFKRRSKKTSKLRVASLCEGNSPVTGEFPAQRASNVENVSIWWRHREHGIIRPPHIQG